MVAVGKGKSKKVKGKRTDRKQRVSYHRPMTKAALNSLLILPFAFLLLPYSLASLEAAALYFRLFGRRAKGNLKP
jgi:hypothetical protein